MTQYYTENPKDSTKALLELINELYPATLLKNQYIEIRKKGERKPTQI